MTTEDLRKGWINYGVQVNGQTHKLEDKYAVCWGHSEQFGGLIFDVGDWSGVWHTYIVENDNLVSVNPSNHAEKQIIGPLVKI